MSRSRATAILSAALALTFAFTTPTWAQEPTAEDPQMTGALAVSLLAVVADYTLLAIQRLITSPGLRT